MDRGVLSDSQVREIEDVLDFIRRKNRLSDDEWEDFHSWVWVRFAETDYAVLRKFEGRGSLRAFLAVTLHRLLLDYRTAKWGKWRPSRRALSLGADGEQLEFYIRCQGYSIGEAIQTMKLNHGSTRTEEELERIASELPVRSRGRELTQDWLNRLASPGPTPHDSLQSKESQTEVRRAAEVLESLLARLEPEERVMLDMRFEQGCKLNEIASALGLTSERFYRRFERLLRKLRRRLETEGIDAQYVDRLFAEKPQARTFVESSVSLHDEEPAAPFRSRR
jgi:RNA polymerase sigma factor (sigma-70 family)